jgi:uncharacterized protein YjbI with pentapeptide repeats
MRAQGDGGMPIKRRSRLGATVHCMPSAHTPRSGSSKAATPPAKPKPPKSLELATLDEDDLRDEGAFTAVGFFDLEMSGRTAKAVEFVQCRFNRVDLSGGSLLKTSFTDCLIEHSNLANLRTDGSTLIRVRIDGARLTGLQWIDGAFRDVTVQDSRLDLSVFRSSDFRATLFSDCNLTRADFAMADLSGAHFVRCDLTAAQFSNAKMAGTRFTDCTLDGIGGVTAFEGASVLTGDLVGLSRALAAALGISLELSDPQAG